MTVEYVPYSKIDKEKWDRCIDKAPNGLIYGYSWYLDAMSANWDGLVSGDYEQVMPLTWKSKFGIHYLYQPPFCASLGVFGPELSAEMLAQFLGAIPDKFKYWDISLNHGNNFKLEQFPVYERMNYVLPLNLPYDHLRGNYKDNIRRNTKKSQESGIKLRTGITTENVIGLAKDQISNFGKIEPDAFERFSKLYELMLPQQQAASYGAYDGNQQLIASAIFFFDNRRAYYILVGNHANGKTLGASHALIDKFIQDHSGKDLILDFEGSDIQSLAFFYSGFGATQEIYPAIRMNRLPWYLRWAKK